MLQKNGFVSNRTLSVSVSAYLYFMSQSTLGYIHIQATDAGSGKFSTDAIFPSRAPKRVHVGNIRAFFDEVTFTTGTILTFCFMITLWIGYFSR